MLKTSLIIIKNVILSQKMCYVQVHCCIILIFHYDTIPENLSFCFIENIKLVDKGKYIVGGRMK